MEPEVLEKIINAPQEIKNDLREAQIDFICTAVRGDTAQIISERMGLVTDLAAQHGGIVFDQISGIVIVAYGTISFKSDSIQAPVSFREALRMQLGMNMKTVYGTAPGHFGCMGGKTRMSFSLIVPGFLDALALLATVPYGEIREFKNK